MLGAKLIRYCEYTYNERGKTKHYICDATLGLGD